MESSTSRVLKARDVLWPLLISSALSSCLFVARVIGGHNLRYWFLIWNLFLAWLPLAFAWLLKSWLAKKSWLSWQGVAYTLVWLGFLPNSFYLVTDFIHLHPTGEVSVLFDAVLFMSFAWNGLILGFISVMLVQAQLLKKFSSRNVTKIIGAVFLLCSFAIYLGRYLTWNTWDIIINPGGILFDISDRLIRPSLFPNTFTTTSMFFVLLSVSYYSVYKLVAALRGKQL